MCGFHAEFCEKPSIHQSHRKRTHVCIHVSMASMPCHAPSSLLFAPRSVTWQVFPEQRHCGLAELRARAARRLERRSGAAGFDDLAAVTTKGRRDAGREDASERTGGGGGKGLRKGPRRCIRQFLSLEYYTDWCDESAGKRVEWVSMEMVLFPMFAPLR